MYRDSYGRWHEDRGTKGQSGTRARWAVIALTILGEATRHIDWYSNGTYLILRFDLRERVSSRESRSGLRPADVQI